jgi:hypothetical protein
MCIACELQMFFAMEDLPPSTGTASHVDPRAENAPRFACDAPANEAPLAVPQPNPDERKPIVKSRE